MATDNPYKWCFVFVWCVSNLSSLLPLLWMYAFSFGGQELLHFFHTNSKVVELHCCWCILLPKILISLGIVGFFLHLLLYQVGANFVNLS